MQILVNYSWNTYHKVTGNSSGKSQEVFYVDGFISLGRMRRMIREDLQSTSNTTIFVDPIMPKDVILATDDELMTQERATEHWKKYEQGN